LRGEIGKDGHRAWLDYHHGDQRRRRPGRSASLAVGPAALEENGYENEGNGSVGQTKGRPRLSWHKLLCSPILRREKLTALVCQSWRGPSSLLSRESSRVFFSWDTSQNELRTCHRNPSWHEKRIAEVNPEPSAVRKAEMTLGSAALTVCATTTVSSRFGSPPDSPE
jgi:hypothetical protein